MNRLINTVLFTLLLCIPAIPPLHACYIDLSKNAIERYVDSNINFHPHHSPQEENYNQISFPIIFCYPIPLETTGDTRWFFTSAIEGSTPYFGEAIIITNPSTTHVYLVRSTIQNNNWFYVYLGVNGNNPKFSNATHKVYQGDPLCIVCKDEVHMVHNDIKYLDTITMATEIRNYLIHTQQNYDCKSPTFKDTFRKALEDCFLQKPGSFFMNNRLLSYASLWAQSENIRNKNRY